MEKFNWSKIEDSNNLICIRDLGQAVELISAAILRPINNYDIKDLFRYLLNTHWYDNFKSETKMRYAVYGNKATFTYGLNDCNLKVIEFEDIFINKD